MHRPLRAWTDSGHSCLHSGCASALGGQLCDLHSPSHCPCCRPCRPLSPASPQHCPLHFKAPCVLCPEPWPLPAHVHVSVSFPGLQGPAHGGVPGITAGVICPQDTGFRNQAAVGLCSSPPSAVVPSPAPSRPVLQCPACKGELSVPARGSGRQDVCSRRSLGSWRRGAVSTALVSIGGSRATGAGVEPVQARGRSRVPSSAPSEGLLLPRSQSISLREALDWLVCATYSPQTRGP